MECLLVHIKSKALSKFGLKGNLTNSRYHGPGVEVMRGVLLGRRVADGRKVAVGVGVVVGVGVKVEVGLRIASAV